MKNQNHKTPRRSQKRGMPPGTLMHIGSRYSERQGLVCHSYDGKNWRQDPDPGNCLKVTGPEPGQTIWLEVNGLADITGLKPVFEQFQVNNLVLEDILNTDQNAKADLGEKWIFFVLKNIDWNQDTLEWSSDQISLLLIPGKVGSFAEKKTELFNPLYSRLLDPASKLRTHGADFTFCAILDLIVDDYISICETLEQGIEDLELRLEGKTGFDPTTSIHQIRKFQLYFRHQVLPVRDGIVKLLRDADHLISSDDIPYYHDILDHLDHIINQLDQLRDNLTSIRDLYLSQMNMGMNKVIQLLTVVSTIFIPITFIAGIYGMNFKNMPELRSDYGYFVVLGIMVLIGLASFIFFRRKRWM